MLLLIPCGKNCLAFIKDNIQPQAFKTWFEPIKPIKLADKALSIQVPSKFFYEWLEEHYVKLLKVALTRELGSNAKLIYIIKMENKYGNKEPFTEQIPSSNRTAVGPQELDVPITSKSPELKNPFVIPGIRNIKIESQLNPNYNFENFFWRATPIGWRDLRGWRLPINLEVLLLTPC